MGWQRTGPDCGFKSRLPPSLAGGTWANGSASTPLTCKEGIATPVRMNRVHLQSARLEPPF